MIASSLSNASMRRVVSSTSAGVACWLIATRAQAVCYPRRGFVPRGDACVYEQNLQNERAATRRVEI